MESILKTTLLEYKKSAFIIELVEYSTGSQYIKIQQTITDENSEKKNSQLSIIEKNIKSSYLSIDQQNEVQRRYLIGVSISNLSLQFDCEESLIMGVLTNAGIEIVSNKIPYKFKKQNFNSFFKSKRK